MTPHPDDNPHPAAPGADHHGSMMAPSLCWACRRMVETEHFCPECAKVQPLPAGMNYFELLGMPVRLNMDERELEQHYYELSRQLHPDFFQRSTETERRLSLDRSAAINTAYRALRTLEGRARYLLELFRQRASAQESGRMATPKSLLLTMFEMQSAVEELRDLPPDAPAAQVEAARGRLREVRSQLDVMRRAQDASLREIADQWDAIDPQESGGPAYEPLLTRMKSVLDERAYLDRLCDNIAQALGEAA